MPEIRQPQRKSSIEKKNKIIDKGFEIMCENGFYNTNAVDIAKYAGVSTGIIYQYFNDKKDIFMQGIKKYYESITFPLLNVIENEDISKDNLRDIVNNIIDAFTLNHKISARAHKELNAMECLDEDIEKMFLSQEIFITDKIVEILRKNNFNVNNLKEKVHLIYGILDKYAHEVVYHKHSGYDYDVMKSEVVSAVINILK